MFKVNVIEFIFNENKYRIEKFVMLLLFGLVIAYLSAVFLISPLIILVPILILTLITSVIKIMWYNKRKNRKTDVMDKIGIAVLLVITIGMLLLYVNEKRLENAVYDVVEEKAGGETFTIKVIDETKNKENHITIAYIIEGDNTTYWEGYYWKDGKLTPDSTSKIGH